MTMMRQLRKIWLSSCEAWGADEACLQLDAEFDRVFEKPRDLDNMRKKTQGENKLYVWELSDLLSNASQVLHILAH